MALTFAAWTWPLSLVPYLEQVGLNIYLSAAASIDAAEIASIEILGKQVEFTSPLFPLPSEQVRPSHFLQRRRGSDTQM